MTLSKLALKTNNNILNGTSNEEPDWIDLDPNVSEDIRFSMDPDDFQLAFKAIKNSTLPQKVIDYLTSEGNFEDLLVLAGFSFDCTGVSNIDAFEFREKLGKYTSGFLDIIAPFVFKGSYIEMVDECDDTYRWEFDGSICELNYLELDCD